MSVDIVYLHIKRAIESNKECFLCALEDELEGKYIDTYLDELVMDPASREKIIESRGFCNHHSYKMLIAAGKPRSLDGHGLALVTKSIVEELVEEFCKQEELSQNHFLRMLPNETKCPACVHLSQFMKMYTKTVAELLSSSHEKFLELFKGSKGLCVPHFVALLYETEKTSHDRNRAIIETVIEVEEKSLRRLDSELAEYVRMQSYEFSEKDREGVEDAVLRGIEKIAGRRGLKLTNLIERRGE
jgi:hypothetical protein